MEFHHFLEDLAPEIVHENAFRGTSAKIRIDQLSEVSKFGLISTNQVYYVILALSKLSQETKAKILEELAEVRRREKEI